MKKIQSPDAGDNFHASLFPLVEMDVSSDDNSLLDSKMYFYYDGYNILKNLQIQERWVRILSTAGSSLQN